MLAAYNRCGGGPNGTDDDEDEPSKGKKLAGFQKRLPLYELNSVSFTSFAFFPLNTSCIYISHYNVHFKAFLVMLTHHHNLKVN